MVPILLYSAMARHRTQTSRRVCVRGAHSTGLSAPTPHTEHPGSYCTVELSLHLHRPTPTVYFRPNSLVYFVSFVQVLRPVSSMVTKLLPLSCCTSLETGFIGTSEYIGTLESSSSRPSSSFSGDRWSSRLRSSPAPFLWILPRLVNAAPSTIQSIFPRHRMSGS